MNFSVVFLAEIRVLVDGGANQWLKFIADHNLSECIEPPHFITGDMDSVSMESLKQLDALKCQRIYTPDQDETDCTKSLIAIRPYLQSTKVIEKKGLNEMYFKMINR